MIAFLLVYLLIGFGTVLGCAFGTRAVMKNKGRSGTAGFFMGLFLGLLGLLIAALLPMTPEYEVYRMQRQVQLMNIASQGMQAGAASGALPVALAPPPQRTPGPITLQSLTIICVATAAVYVVVSLWDGFAVVADMNYRGVVVVLALAVAVLAVVGLRRASEPMVLGALGAMLGFGSAGFARLLGWENFTSGNVAWVFVSIADIALAVAVCLALRGGLRLTVPTGMWIGLCAALAGTTLIAGLEAKGASIDVVGMGVILILVAAARRTERALWLVAGWGPGVLLRMLTWIGPRTRWYYRSLFESTTWIKLVGVAGAALAAASIVQLRQGASALAEPAVVSANTVPPPPNPAPMAPPSPANGSPLPPPMPRDGFGPNGGG